NLRRWVFSVTSGSGVVVGVGTDERWLALYAKFSWAGGLQLLGTEGQVGGVCAHTEGTRRTRARSRLLAGWLTGGDGGCRRNGASMGQHERKGHAHARTRKQRGRCVFLSRWQTTAHGDCSEHRAPVVEHDRRSPAPRL